MKKLFFILVMLAAMNASAQWLSTSAPIGGTVNALVISGSNIYAGTQNTGVFLSTNNGTNWTVKGLTGMEITSLAVSGSTIFAGANYNGVYLSTNNGSNWTAVNTGLNGQYIRAIAVSGSNIFAGTFNGGVFLSTNNGANWTSVGLTDRGIWTFAVSGTNIFAGTYNTGGLYLSTNNGTNWTLTGLSGVPIWSLAISGSNIFAGTDGMMYLSTNNSSNWTSKVLASTTLRINKIVLTGTNIFAGFSDHGAMHGDGVYLSTNNGTSWINKNQGFGYPPPSIHSLLIVNNSIFAGAFSNTAGSVWYRVLSEILQVQRISTDIPSSYSLEQNYPNPFNPVTKIRFDLSRTENGKQKTITKLVVYDITGKEILVLVNEELQPGSYEVTFDGSGLNSGVYFYQLIAGSYRETRRMVLIK
jgi:hypothetical protein